MSADDRFLGKYRGMVVNNVDPEQRGRLQAQVPDVLGPSITSWALPCFPCGGVGSGMVSVPAPGAGVWIEFEQGDPDFPVWTGIFFGSMAEMPGLAQSAPPPTPAITLQTPLGNGCIISDGLGPTGVGGITLTTPTGAMIAVNEVGITISNGKGAQITLTGPTVDINNGALTVV